MYLTHQSVPSNIDLLTAVPPPPLPPRCHRPTKHLCTLAFHSILDTYLLELSFEIKMYVLCTIQDMIANIEGFFTLNSNNESLTCAVFLPPLVTMLSELVGYWNACNRCISSNSWIIFGVENLEIPGWELLPPHSSHRGRPLELEATPPSSPPPKRVSPENFNCWARLESVGVCGGRVNKSLSKDQSRELFVNQSLAT